MLDESDNTQITPTGDTPAENTAAPRRRRRAASRPAGPPAPVTPSAQPAQTTESPAPDETSTPETQASQKPSTEDAPRRTRKTAARKRVVRQKADPETSAAESQAAAEEPQTLPEAAKAEQSAKKAPAKKAPAKRTRRRKSAEPAQETLVESTDTDSGETEDELEARLRQAATEAAGRGRRGVSGVVANPFGAGEDTDSVLQSLAASIAGATPSATREPFAEPTVEAPAVDETPEDGDETPHQAETDAAETSVDEDEASDTEGTDSEGSAAEEDSDDDQDSDDPDSDDDSDSEDDSEDDSNDDDSEGPRRRRRRRGGRRRRRGSSSSDDSNDDSEGDDSADSSDDDQDSTDESGQDNAASADEQSDSGRRRRRRRRRRGEDTGASEDDPNEVVVRVREPRRSSRPASDEVTGIEGSTRLEAKRQRRREGRAAGRRRAPILSEAEFLARRESVKRSMLIRERDDYTQLAVLEDDILVEHYVDRASATSLIGNVYLGRVQNVLPSMEAAFIDIGRGRNAVLYAGEVDWETYGAQGGQRKIEQVFKSGQTVLVQVSKDPVGAKGARLTGHVSIPGRYVVYSPGGQLSGISRKLADTERHRLKDILGHLIDEKSSVIVRTAAEGASEDELVRDVTRLKAQWEAIEKRVKQGSAPQLLYSEPDLTVRIVRDLFTEDFQELVVQGNDIGETITNYVEHVAPHLMERISRHDPEQGDIFAKFRIDEQIAKALERKVFLPSGGSLIIDRTEAMTVVDVNTGRFTGTAGNLEATVTSNNLEAAEEIVRQLRLRDIGGIIVIDFIDMVLPSNRELLVRRLVECLARDRTRHQVAEVSSLGLVQMTRKKIGTGLAEAFTEECEHCGGRGYHRFEDPVESQSQADGGDRHSRGRGSKGGRGSSRSESSNSRSDKSNGTVDKAESGKKDESGDGGSERAATREGADKPDAEKSENDAEKSENKDESGTPSSVRRPRGGRSSRSRGRGSVTDSNDEQQPGSGEQGRDEAGDGGATVAELVKDQVDQAKQATAQDPASQDSAPHEAASREPARESQESIERQPPLHEGEPQQA